MVRFFRYFYRKVYFIYFNDFFIKSFLFFHKILFGRVVSVDCRLKRNRKYFVDSTNSRKLIGIERKQISRLMENFNKIVRPMITDWENNYKPTPPEFVKRIRLISENL